MTTRTISISSLQQKSIGARNVPHSYDNQYKKYSKKQIDGLVTVRTPSGCLRDAFGKWDKATPHICLKL